MLVMIWCWEIRSWHEQRPLWCCSHCVLWKLLHEEPADESGVQLCCSEVCRPRRCCSSSEIWTIQIGVQKWDFPADGLFVSETSSRLLPSPTGWTAVTPCAWSAGPAARWGGRASWETGPPWGSQSATAVTRAALCSLRTPQDGEKTATRVRAPSASPRWNPPTIRRRRAQTARRTTPPPLTTPPSPPAARTAPCGGRRWTPTAGRTTKTRRTARCPCCWSPHSARSIRRRKPEAELCVWGGRFPDSPLTLLLGAPQGRMWTDRHLASSAPLGRDWSAWGKGRLLHIWKVPSGPSGTIHPSRYFNILLVWIQLLRWWRTFSCRMFSFSYLVADPQLRVLDLVILRYEYALIKIIPLLALFCVQHKISRNNTNAYCYNATKFREFYVHDYFCTLSIKSLTAGNKRRPLKWILTMQKLCSSTLILRIHHLAHLRCSPASPHVMKLHGL